MDQQEETIEHINRKRRIQATPSIPLDVISEILSKLPTKSVGRFRCVSKLWSSVTTDPYFINRFETQSRQKKPSLLVTFKRGDRLFVFSIPQDRQTPNQPHSISSQPVHSYHIRYPKHCSFLPKESVHGLISFANLSKPMIWNPTIRKFLTLNKPEKSWMNTMVFLGYDPINNKHKVLCMPFNETIDECRVLTLGSAQGSWRKIKTNHKYLIRGYDTNYKCINGVLYYKAYADQPDNADTIIMSFDVRSEKFHMIKFPWNNIRYCGELRLYKGMLACTRSNYPGQGITLWILQDAEKHVWSPKTFFSLSLTMIRVSK
ncbi:hypothetical protein Bca52824_033528 [Brassica carinata]|uniref:F-box domain-containing protein n=1 Tax=Brassica carinata TaxID=52824 RepID=A0A8X7V7E8_BRACI|nr:hypothetical protein Bca52824_033528 [Brassica carinata]